MTTLAVSFSNSTMLLALLLVPALLYVHWLMEKKARRYPVRFTALDTLASVIPKGPDWRRHLPVGLLCAAIAATAFALAKPEREKDIAVQRATVVLVTDISRSMEATDVTPSRLDAARNAALAFLDKVPGEVRVGLVAFSDAAQTVQTPTSDHDQVVSALGVLTPQAGTSTGAGLNNALDDLRTLRKQDPRQPPSAIILLSDGSATDGNAAFVAAQQSKKINTPIYTVALGTPDGEVELPDGRILSVPPDPAALARIAQLSGGSAFQAESSDSLNAVYEKLGSQLGTRKENRQVTSAFVGVALFLLLAAILAALRFGTRPI